MHNDQRCKQCLFSKVKRLFIFVCFFQATQYSNLGYIKSPRQQSHYCFGYVPSGMCLCLQGKPGSLEWIFEILMWTQYWGTRGSSPSDGPHLRGGSFHAFQQPLMFRGVIWRGSLQRARQSCVQVWWKVTFRASLGTHQSVVGSVNSQLILYLYMCTCRCLQTFCMFSCGHNTSLPWFYNQLGFWLCNGKIM